MSETLELLAVISVLPTSNIQTAPPLPPASSVRVPVNCTDEAKQ
jgi:hypothetical protein